MDQPPASLVVSQRNLQQVRLFGLILQSMGFLFLLHRDSPNKLPKKLGGDMLASCHRREDIQILLRRFRHVLLHNLLTLPLVTVNSQLDVTSFNRSGQTSTTILSSEEVDATSWTAGKASKSPHAQLISSRSRRKHPHMAVSLNPIDRVRWWLLRPGHIEFVLWLGGTILLVAVTCMLLLVTVFSFEWITPGIISHTWTNTSGNSTGSGQQSTAVAAPEMVLMRIDKGPILPGHSIGLRGKGFSPLGHIRFLFDV